MKGRGTSRKTTSLLATAAVALIALAYLLFLFLPKQESIAEMRGQLNEKRQFVLAADQLGHSIRAANDELTLASEYIQAWESRSPSVATLADYYEQLSASAADAGVAVTKFDPQPVKTMDRICQLPIQLAVEGSFEQIVAMLHRIETLGTTIRIELITVQPLARRAPRNTRPFESTGESRQTSSDSLSIQCQITMHVFADKTKFSD